MIGLLCGGLWASWELEGTADPMWAVDSGEGGWMILRQPPGDWPELWILGSQGESRSVKLPPKLHRVAPIHASRRMYLIGPDWAALAEYDPDGQVRILRKRSVDLPRFTLPVWQLSPAHSLGVWFQIGTSAWLLDPELNLHRLPPVKVEPQADSNHLERMALGGQFMDRRVEAPALRSIEKAVGVPTRDGVSWFRYGGESGDLGSMGWSLSDGQRELKDEGIVVAFGPDAGGADRYVVLSITNSLFKLIGAGLFGSKRYRCHTLVRSDGRWHHRGEIAFSFKKEDREHFKTTLSWTLDANGDGFGDLLVADDPKGVRWFMSRGEGSFTEKPIQVDLPHDRLLASRSGLLAFRYSNQTWSVHQVALP